MLQPHGGLGRATRFRHDRGLGRGPAQARLGRKVLPGGREAASFWQLLLFTELSWLRVEGDIGWEMGCEKVG